MDQMKIQVVICGTGDQNLQWGFAAHAAKYPGRVGTFIGFNEAKAHLVYAGSDSFLIPSRFEPCGLAQMYAMRYGTLPLARSTGGLADTIEQYQENTSGSSTDSTSASAQSLRPGAAQTLSSPTSAGQSKGCQGTGFLFNDPTADALFNTIGWACATWYDRNDDWKKLQQNGMAKEFGWEKSALQYELLYAAAVEQRTGKKVALPDRSKTETHGGPELMTA